MTEETLTNENIAAAGLDDWRVLGRALQARFRTGDFATGLRLVNRIGEAAEHANHHPDLDLRYGHLNVRLFSHDVLDVTDRDLALARRISDLAAQEGATAEPAALAKFELALDTPDHAAVKPFWRAALGYRDHPTADDEVRNDDADLPPLWFQRSGAEEPRQRFHVDLRVPPEAAKERIAAALAAGGTKVAEMSTFTVLADADGNRVCICTG